MVYTLTKEMGGCAHIIAGIVREEALIPKSPKRGFWARLFVGSKHDEVRRSNFGESTLIDVPCPGLSKKVHADFTRYLRERIPRPDKATESIFGYLGIAETTVYIRGEEKVDSSSWYTQLTFSGCAGMADISAEVSAHWAAVWSRDRLDEFLRPLLNDYGFEVSEHTDTSHDNYTFIRVDVDGQNLYAGLGADGSIELDGAIYEGVTEDFEQFNERMESLYRHKAPLQSCECQLCQQQLNQQDGGGNSAAL